MYLITFNIHQVNTDLEMAKAAAQEYFNAHPRLSFAAKTLEEYTQHDVYRKLCDAVTSFSGDIGKTVLVEGELVQAIWGDAREVLYIVYYDKKLHCLRESQIVSVIPQREKAYIDKPNPIVGQQVASTTNPLKVLADKPNLPKGE